MRELLQIDKPEINELLPSRTTTRPPPTHAATKVSGMTVRNVELSAYPVAATHGDLRQLAARLPRMVRFMGVGMLGLTTDMLVFTLISLYEPRPLLVRLVSISCATFVTWRLNRALTFDRTGRHQGHEALRYGAVTATAQTMSYTVFAILVLTWLDWFPQAAMLCGAAAGALIAYNGHRLFAFAPRTRAHG
jgi:putative flippase GtrA